MFWLPGFPTVIVIGSAKAVDEAMTMIANAAEARIRRCRLKIRGMLRDSLSWFPKL